MFDSKFLYQIVATILVYNLIKLVLFLRVRIKRYKLLRYYNIPGPSQNIWNGNYEEYRRHLAHFKTDDKYKSRYGKTYGIFIGDNAQIMSTDLDLLKKVFIEKSASFKNRMHLFVDSPLNRSILFAVHDRWKLMRKLMAPTFKTYNARGDQSLAFVEHSIELLLEYLKDRSEDCSKGTIVELDFQNLMRSVSLHLISQMAINFPEVHIGETQSQVRALSSVLGQASGTLIELVVQYPCMRSTVDFVTRHTEWATIMGTINKNLERAIDEKLDELRTGRSNSKTTKTPRLMEVLIESHHRGLLTRDEVIANCLAILVAGFETTSTALTYLFWVFGRYSEIQEKVRQELKIYGTESKYLGQVIDETLRLYPVSIVFQSRECTQTVEVGKIVIPQGTRVNYNTWLVHRDPDIWPDPLKFDPERFKPGVVFHPCAYAPFGLGARRCIGEQLAKLELKMITCEILLRYQVHLKAPKDLELISYANALSRSSEKVLIGLERLE